MKSNFGITGKIKVQIFDKENNLRYESVNHNIITDEGDAYIADLLSLVPTRTKFSPTNCFISVGTGWTGNNTKNNSWVNTQVGSAHIIDSTYPKLSGSWGAINDNVLQFQATFEAGTLNATGINEAALTTHSNRSALNSTVAYAQVAPSVNVSSTDTLIIGWELTFLGA